MISTAIESWTNESVLLMADGKDPVLAMLSIARDVVINAMDRGWDGPPFDPVALARLLEIDIRPSDGVRDARLVPLDDGSLRIEFNPNRPHARIRYSVAHEVAHALFPDCAKHIHHRARYHELRNDEWQLEALCNIGASELLMPVNAFPGLTADEATAIRLLELQREFQVSVEALAMRVVRINADACAMFCASRTESGPNEGRYKLDYVVPSPSWSGSLGSGQLLPPDTALTNCTAIGFTDSAYEQWDSGQQLFSVQAIGVPPYPGSVFPRVVGIVSLPDDQAVELPHLHFVVGDALQPRGGGANIIAHVVNDKTPRWGGHGFAQAVGGRWPVVQADFITQVAMRPGLFALGNVLVSQPTDNLWIASMICQHGYGPSPTPRIRYGALKNCLKEVAQLAARHQATVHMPRIGTGFAGGSWSLIVELILESLSHAGISTTIYDPPARSSRVANQQSLFGPEAPVSRA